MKLLEIKTAKLPNEITDFRPIECMDCNYHGHIPKRFFIVEPKVNSQEEYDELCTFVKEKLGFNSFGETGYEEKQLIAVCRCPQCGSEEIFEDF